MNYTRQIELTNEFKAATKNKAFRPTKDEQYGTQYDGDLNYLHYVFYAVLRDKDIRTTTHNINAPKYEFRKLQLLMFIQNVGQRLDTVKYSYGCYYEDNVNDIFNALKVIFPTLTMEEAISVIKEYNQNHYSYFN